MFSQIQESDDKRMEKMRKHLGWFYGRLAKNSVPEASHPIWSEFLPKVILAPDFPVPKRSKVRLRDVTINDGLHWHGLARWCRCLGAGLTGGSGLGDRTPLPRAGMSGWWGIPAGNMKRRIFLVPRWNHQRTMQLRPRV
jgi:hypothetical protein